MSWSSDAQVGHVRRRAALAAATALLVVGAAGCGGDEGGSGDGSTVTVQAQSLQIPVFQDVAKRFQADHPGVTVKIVNLTDEQKNTTNAQILASSDAPDVAIVPINSTPYTQLIRAKALMPLDDVWQRAGLQQKYGGAADSLKTDGTPYLAQFDSVLYNAVYYNQQAFEQAGVPVPQNHQMASDQELYDAVTKLKAAGMDGLAVGGASSNGYKYGWMLDAQLAANADPAALQDFNSSWQTGATQAVEYTDPQFVDSLQQLQDWQDHGVFATGHVGATDDQAQAQFTSGGAAMLLGHNVSADQIEKAQPTFGFDWFLLPGATAGKPTLPTIYSGDTFAVPTKAANADLGKQFIEYFMTDESQSQQAALSGQLPAVNSVDPASLQGLNPMAQDIYAFAGANGTGAGWTSVTPGPLGQSFIGPELQQQLNGAQTPAQTGENMQQHFEEYEASNG